MKQAQKSEVAFVIGKTIVEFRRDKNLTQKQLADYVGVSIQQIQKYEYGETNISVNRLLEIATAFDICIIELLKPALSNYYSTESDYLMVFNNPVDVEIATKIRKLNQKKKQTFLDLLSN